HLLRIQCVATDEADEVIVANGADGIEWDVEPGSRVRASLYGNPHRIRWPIAGKTPCSIRYAIIRWIVPGSRVQYKEVGRVHSHLDVRYQRVAHIHPPISNGPVVSVIADYQVF